MLTLHGNRWSRFPIVLVIVLGSVSAHASPESQKLTEQGNELLETGRYSEAHDKFRQAAETDPQDAQALFFQAVSDNRLGEHGRAVQALRQATAMGYKHVQMTFEAGWALLGTGHYKEAIANLEAYEQAKSGRGQTLEFLGRAHYHLGHLDEAEKFLEKAVQRNAELKPTVDIYLAMVLSKRGNKTAARRRVKDLMKQPSDSITARFLHEYMVAKRADRPWRLSISLGTGWNDNVTALPENVSLPADISDRSSAFGSFGLSSSYDLLRRSDDTVTAGYVFRGDLYEQSNDQSNLDDHYFYLDWSHRFNDKHSGTLRMSDQYSFVGGNDFRNRIGIRPALLTRHFDWLVSEVSYQYTTSEYFFPNGLGPATDRDGDAHTIGITARFRVPDTNLSGLLGYSHTWNEASGDDFDYDSDTLSVGFDHPLPWDMTLGVRYSHTWGDYDNINSLAGVVRDDDIDAVSVQLVKPIQLPVGYSSRIYFRYGYTSDDSNITSFDYDQHVYSVGLVVDF